MAQSPTVDQCGRRIEYAQLTKEVAGRRVTGVRQGWHRSVAGGMTPERLGGLLNAAAEGDARDYLTLAEEMEERDLHYASVLGTRKLALAGLSIRVEAATDDTEDVRRADTVREVVDSAEFGELQKDLTDALGKGHTRAVTLWARRDRTGGV